MFVCADMWCVARRSTTSNQPPPGHHGSYGGTAYHPRGDYGAQAYGSSSYSHSAYDLAVATAPAAPPAAQQPTYAPAPGGAMTGHTVPYAGNAAAAAHQAPYPPQRYHQAPSGSVDHMHGGGGPGVGAMHPHAAPPVAPSAVPQQPARPDMEGFPLIRLDHVPLLNDSLLRRAHAELNELLASIGHVRNRVCVCCGAADVVCTAAVAITCAMRVLVGVRVT